MPSNKGLQRGVLSVTVHTDIHTSGMFDTAIAHKQLHKEMVTLSTISLSTYFIANYDRGLRSVLTIRWSVHQSTDLRCFHTSTLRDVSLHPQQVAPTLVLFFLFSSTLFLHDLPISLSNRMPATLYVFFPSYSIFKSQATST